MGGVLADLRYAARALARNPGFVLVVIVTLALGIGANTAIFTLLDQVMLRPLPVRQPDRLVLLDASGPGIGFNTSNKSSPRPLSFPMYIDLRDRVRGFAGVLAYYAVGVHLSGGGTAERLDGELVSGNYFEVLGLTPAAGRLLGADDDRVPGGHAVAVLSHALWRQRFGGGSSILGQGVVINGHSFTVVGVAPPGFRGMELGRTPDVFLPLMMKAEVTPTWDRLFDRRAEWLTVVARLRPGTGRREAEAEAQVAFGEALRGEVPLLRSASSSFRERFLARRLRLLPGGGGASSLKEAAAAPLTILMATVATVLLIACANVANLLLVRASSRQRDLAVRLSLGARRGRLIRQFLAESVLLSAAGGLLGLVFSAWTGALLVQALPAESERRSLTGAPDLRVLAFAFGLSLLVSLLCGLLPAWQATRQALQTALRQGGSLSGSGPVGRTRRGLVVAQIALSLLLLVGAGLFTRSLAQLQAVSPGFDTKLLLTFTVDPALNGYDLAGRRRLVRGLEEALLALPEVRAVTQAEDPLLAGDVTQLSIAVEGHRPREGEDLNPHYNNVGASFFATLGIPLRAGRGFDERDTLGAPRVAVVNETFARYFFGSASPLGRRLRIGGGKHDVEIVGVARDARSASLHAQPRLVYLPWAQQSAVESLTFYVRTHGDESAAAVRVRQTVSRVDPTLPLHGLKTMRDQVRESVFSERTVTLLAGAFAVLATLLAAVGLYGLMSYSVDQRRREVGVRVALGATRRDIVGLVMREAGRLGALGLAAGLPAALGAAHLVRSQIYGLAPHDPVTIAVATVLLMTVTLLAGWLPARRATRFDPVTALRAE